jgi:SAM-dependent methyltransferase
MSNLIRDHAGQLDRPLTIVDMGCGDFQVGRALLERLPAGTSYVGCDIVPELVAHNNETYGNECVRFQQLDLVSDPLPDGDICLVRQVLQHLSNADIQSFFQRTDYRWIYLTEGHPALRTGTVNPDKKAGHEVRFDWRTGRGRGVEVNRPPFNLATEEMFRATTPPHEVIVTEQVFVSGKTPAMASNSELAGARYGG